MKSNPLAGIFGSLILILFLSAFHQATAQSQYVTMTIKAVQVYGTYDANNEAEDYRYKIYYKNSTPATCLKVDNINHHTWVSTNYTVVSNRSVTLTEAIELEVEAWEEDGCTDCLYTGGGGCGDNAHTDQAAGTIQSPSQFAGSSTFNLYDFTPGANATDNLVTIEYGWGYQVQFRITYTIPLADVTQIKFGESVSSLSVYTSGNVCTETLHLSAQTALNPTFNSQLTYTWQYWAGDYVEVANPDYCGGTIACEPEPDNPFWTEPPCCSVSPTIMAENWQTVPGTSSGTEVKEILNIRALNGLGSISVNTDVTFRVYASANGSTGSYSATKTISLSPAPPVIGSVTTETSCAVDPRGKIHVTGISGLGTYKYILRKGNKPDACNPDISGDCLTGEKSGDINGSSVDILNVRYEADSYTLLVVNSGGTNGVCFSAVYPVYVDKIPDLNIPTFSDTDISRHDYAEGSITFTTANGEQSAVTYNLYNSTSGQTLTSPTNSSGTLQFSNLPIGNYTLTVGDGGCSGDVPKTTEITRPKKVVKTSFDKAAATCNNPGNGYITVQYTKTSGAFDTQPPSTSEYNVKLIKDGTEWANWNTTATDWNRSDLPPGNYVLYVKENGGLDDNDYDETFTISPPATLGVSGIIATDAKCFEGSDGRITFTPSGGSGTYGYELKKGSTTLSNTSPEFTGLNLGDYELTIKNTVSGCTDKYVHPSTIHVDDPAAITFTMSSTNLTCFEDGSGTASTVIDGGTKKPSSPYYDITWQKETTPGVWATYSGPTNTLQIGKYRVSVTDANNCPATSDFVNITQPDPLTIASFSVQQHIVCYGDKGVLSFSSSGGNGSYSYSYSTDYGDTFSPLVPLNAGEYVIKTKDFKGCEFFDADNPYILSGPDEPLDFDYVLSDHDGFTNKCFGDDTGEITLTAFGGNDYGFSGYTFKKGSGTYGTSTFFNTNYAVDNSFTVKDGRGCEVSKTITFTQPDNVVLSLDSKKDVDCFGMPTGEIELNTVGGFGSYEYRLGSGAPQASSLFTGLLAGTHSFTVKDEHQCEATFSQAIVNLYPELEVDPVIKDVSCFDGSDGRITLNVSGGVTPYEFHRGINPVSNPVEGLVAGTYEIIVNDSKGCLVETGEVLVEEPELLTITNVGLTDIKCFGEKGNIEITSGGGTTPYTFEYSLDNLSTFTSFISTTPLSAGDYRVRTVDAQGCISLHANTFAITSPAAILDFTHVKSDYNGYNVTCNGEDDGYVTLTPTGGNGASYSGYMYSIDAAQFQGDSFLQNINAGDHVISVKDGRDCIKEKTINFTQAQPVTVSLLQKKDVECFGASTGEIEASAAGGTGVYQFKIGTASFGDSPVFSGLSAADYTITVQDENFCPASFDQTIINANPALAIAVDDVQHVSCYQGNNGTITLDVSGGVTPYQYKIGSQNTVNPVPDLSAGTYRITVTDNKGCATESEDIVVDQPDDLIITSVQVNDIRCLGEKGTIEIQASGGTMPHVFEYDIINDPGDSFISFNSSTPLSAKDYKLRVTDVQGCISLAATAIITEPSALDYTYVLSDYNGFNISCFGGSNGHITVTSSGGNGSVYTGYQYSIDSAPFNGDNFIPGINAGNHRIAIKDGRGCVAEKIIPFIQSDDEITAEIISKENVVCFGASTGMLEASATGGTNVFEYQLGTSAFQSSGKFPGLPASDYVLTIRDGNKCAVTISDKIINTNEPVVIQVDAVKDANCFNGQDGEIALNVSGGVSPYSYAVAGVLVNHPVAQLKAGTYKVLITDSKGCERESGDILVSQPNDLVVSNIKINDIRCLGENGTIEMTATGGTTPYSFEYDLSSESGVSFILFDNTTPLKAADYQLRAKDSHGCLSINHQSIITQPSASLDFTHKLSDYNGYNISCFGQNNGHITITPSGGNGSVYSGYEYALDASQFGTANYIPAINAGNHKISIKDGRNCVVEKTIFFTQSQEKILAEIERRKDITCVDHLTGELEIKVTGGASPYQYKLGLGQPQNSKLFSGLGLGNYTVTVSDVNSCDAEVSTTISSLNTEMILSSSVIDVNCFAGQDGSIEMFVNGGAIPYKYEWEGLSEASGKVSGLKTNTYKVTVTDNAGCIKKTEALVSQPNAPLQITVSSIAACYGKSDGTVSIEAKGGTAPYQYSADNGASYQNNFQFALPVASYFVKVLDAKACPAEAATTVTQRNEKPEPNFIVATRRNALDTLVLSEISVPKPESVFWTFDPLAILIDNDEWNPEIRFNEPGAYTVSMQAFYPLGCDYTITKTLTINPYDPNAVKEKERGYKPIESVTVSPNPTRGEFSVAVELSKKYNVSLVIYDMIGTIHYNKKWEEITELKESINLADVSSGVFVLRVITEFGAEDVRIIVTK